MNKKRIEIMITSVLVAVLIAAWVYSAKLIKKRSEPGLVLEAVSGAVSLSQGGTAVLQEKSNYDEIVLEQAAWGRCPFSGKAYSVKEGNLDLLITGIFWDEKSPHALVNDQVVQVGAIVGQYKIVNIKTGSIIFNDGNKDFEIKFGE